MEQREKNRVILLARLVIRLNTREEVNKISIVIPDNDQLRPYWGPAIEEFLLKKLKGEYIMLWCSGPSVVVGKHQNALAEVDYRYVYQRGIPVVRRLSGGGAVFHGPGNLNFSFILEGKPGFLVDFRKYTQPVISFLEELGLPARFEGKNDIRINGLKVSGNAEHVYRNRVLHHGTLLYNADLNNLDASIGAAPGRYHDNGVKSARSRVANVSSFLSDAPGFEEFRDMLSVYLKGYFGTSSEYRLTCSDIAAIHRLVDEKYSRWDWNYGYSPDYSFRGTALLDEGDLSLTLGVSKGVIESAAISGTGTSIDWKKFAGDLKGEKHKPSHILSLLTEHGLNEKDSKTIGGELLPLFF